MNKSKAKRRQVLLCGTQYGQAYLPAIYQEKGFELAGILARGSDRSVRLAEQHGVKLYTHIEQIDEEIDVACIAINELVSVPLAQALIAQGIATLVEHPMSGESMRALIASTELGGGVCHINGHFPELPPIADFIRLSQKLNQFSQPRIINICCNSRTLFSSLDILMRCFGVIDLAPLSMHTAGHYQNATTLLSSEAFSPVPLTLAYQQWRYSQDDSRDSPLGHQITITYPEGVLSLGGTFGPCLWFPLIAAGVPAESFLYEPVSRQYNRTITVAEMVQWRVLANQQTLRELVAEQRESILHCTASYMTRLCSLWSELFALLGSATHTTEPNTKQKNILTPQMLLEV